MRNFLVFLTIFLVFAPVLIPGDEAGGFSASTDLEIQLSTVPEAKIRINQSFTFPFLQGSSPLTEDNNIEFTISADISPVSLAGIGEITLTPAAFFQIAGGGQAGSGWNMALGNGIGLRGPGAVDQGLRKAKIDGNPFDGLIWQAWGAGILQFDLGAVFPGPWNHVVFQTRQEFRYSAYTRAGPNDYWIFEGDDGENRNGWKYRPSYTLGYMMPQSPVLNFVGFMAEMEKPLYNGIEGAENWGEGLEKWVFSGLFNFSINPRFDTLLAIQMRTRRNHGLADFNNKDIYYQDLPLQNEGGQRQILFHRAALIMNFKIR